jgi:hypothetical protein
MLSGMLNTAVDTGVDMDKAQDMPAGADPECLD